MFSHRKCGARRAAAAPRGALVGFAGDARAAAAFAFGTLAGAQKRGGTAAYIDISQNFDAAAAAAAGVDCAALAVAQPDSAENAIGICTALAESGAVDAIVVDGAAMLVPEEEMCFVSGFDGYEPPPPPAELLGELAAAVRRAGVLCVFAGIAPGPRAAAGRGGAFSFFSRLFKRRARNASFAQSLYAAMDAVLRPAAQECVPPPAARTAQAPEEGASAAA